MAKYAITAVQPPASVPACHASEDDIPVCENDIPAWSGLKTQSWAQKDSQTFYVAGVSAAQQYQWGTVWTLGQLGQA